MHIASLALAALAAALIPVPALAHHSSAMFDSGRTVAIEGILMRYDWTNPHVYLFVEQTTDAGSVQWEVEGPPPGVLSRDGWSKDTLAAGDRVKIAGNPYKDSSRTMLLLVSLERGGRNLLDMA